LISWFSYLSDKKLDRIKRQAKVASLPGYKQRQIGRKERGKQSTYMKVIPYSQNNFFLPIRKLLLSQEKVFSIE
jgi:hypothetical protein